MTGKTDAERARAYRDRRRGGPPRQLSDDRWPTAMYRVGKKAAGRELDGRTYDEMP